MTLSLVKPKIYPVKWDAEFSKVNNSYCLRAVSKHVEHYVEIYKETSWSTKCLPYLLQNHFYWIHLDISWFHITRYNVECQKISNRMRINASICE